jgi:MscS family membrane protein
MILESTWVWMPNWKWLVVVAGVIGGYLALGPSRSIIHWLKKKYAETNKLPKVMKYFFAKDIERPLAWLVACLLWSLTFHILMDLHENVVRAIGLALHLILLINLMRLAYLAVESVGQLVEDFAEASGNSMDGQLGPFATRVLKILVIVIGFLMSLQSLGLNVGALLAGLGIGSLAFALAAQDTVANLFGSITLIFDRPFQRGDDIRVGDIEGCVEEVGFRSTQIRTAAKTLITIPNAIMAKEKIENFSARNLRRFRHNLNLSIDNSPELIESFVMEVRHLLAQTSQVVTDHVTVGLASVNGQESKFLIEAYLKVNSWEEEFTLSETLLLQILKIAKLRQIKFWENPLLK